MSKLDLLQIQCSKSKKLQIVSRFIKNLGPC